MTNEYFAHTEVQEANTLARAVSINSSFSAVQSAFDKLPTEAGLKLGTVTFGEDAGNANAHQVTLAHAPTGYVEGAVVAFKALETNTGPATVDIMGPSVLLGPKAIKRLDRTALKAGDIIAGSIVVLYYEGEHFQMIGSAGDAADSRQSATEAASSAAAAQQTATSAVDDLANAIALAQQTLNGLVSEAQASANAANQSASDAQASADTAEAISGHVHVKADVGLGNVDNTSDADKPVSGATQAALNQKRGTSNFKFVSANSTASNLDVIAVNTTSVVTITSPSNPLAQQSFRVSDSTGSADTNNITITFGTETLEGEAEDFIINTPYLSMGFIYAGNTWHLVP